METTLAAAGEFPTFIDRVIAGFPDGFLADFYSRFVGPKERPIEFIGRHEATSRSNRPR